MGLEQIVAAYASDFISTYAPPNFGVYYILHSDFDTEVLGQVFSKEERKNWEAKIAYEEQLIMYNAKLPRNLVPGERALRRYKAGEAMPKSSVAVSELAYRGFKFPLRASDSGFGEMNRLAALLLYTGELDRNFTPRISIGSEKDVPEWMKALLPRMNLSLASVSGKARERGNGNIAVVGECGNAIGRLAYVMGVSKGPKSHSYKSFPKYIRELKDEFSSGNNDAFEPLSQFLGILFGVKGSLHSPRVVRVRLPAIAKRRKSEELAKELADLVQATFGIMAYKTGIEERSAMRNGSAYTLYTPIVHYDRESVSSAFGSLADSLNIGRLRALV